MRLQGALLAADPVFLHWLQDAIESSVDLHHQPPGDSTEENLEELARHPRLSLIFVHVSPEQPQVRLLEALVEAHPQAAVVAIGTESDPDLVIDAMRAGARDFLIYGRDDRELRGRLQKLLSRLGPSPSAPTTQGQILTLFNGVPDHGLAWAAVHLGLVAAGAATAEKRVLLVDAALPSGAAPVFLNANQTYTLLDGLRDLDRCDQTLVDTAFTRHASGLYLLSLPEDHIGPTAIDAQEFVELMQILSGFFHRVIIAAGSNLPLAALAGVLRESHASVFVSQPSILNSRANKHVLRALRLEGGRFERTGLVVDQPARGLGLQPENLAELLELPLWGALGGNPAQRAQAMDAGEPLFTRAPRDAYCDDIRTLFQRLRAENPAALGSATVRRRGLFASLTGG